MLRCWGECGWGALVVERHVVLSPNRCRGRGVEVSVCMSGRHVGRQACMYVRQACRQADMCVCQAGR